MAEENQTAQSAAESKPAARRNTLRQGIVASDKRDKTRTVMVSYQLKHPKYGKYLARQTKFQVHDEKNETKVGDLVEIASCRPISKTKSWRVLRVLRSAPAV